MQARSECVYFVRCETNGLIKIGYSRENPDGRFISIRSACPVPISRLAVMDGSRELERDLHVRFASSRVRGEWFRPTDALLRFIAEHAATWSPPERGARVYVSYGPAVAVAKVKRAADMIRRDGVPTTEQIKAMKRPLRRAVMIALHELGY